MKPTQDELREFFSNYAGETLNAEDFAVLYSEEFSDRFTDQEVDSGVLDTYINNAWSLYLAHSL